MPATRPTILFLCVHNAGRSQAAAAFTRALAGGLVRVLSAGSAPAASLNPVVVQAMAEAGIDLSRETPRPLDPAAFEAAGIVVTMGCGDTCPVLPGRRHLDWPVADPAGQPIETVRAICEEIRDRVEGLLVELGIVPGSIAAR